MIVQLGIDEFLSRARKIDSYAALKELRESAVSTENTYRELFARQRESWEIPEIDDPYVFLANVYQQQTKANNSNSKDSTIILGDNSQLFRRLPRFEDDTTPRCFPLTNYTPGSLSIQPNLTEFQISWDCITEGLLRFINWNNVFCAGGAVSGCLSPLSDHILEGGHAATRVKRRKYYHDEFLPGSDIDLFLYGLTEEQAEAKLVEIYDAIQAANPYQVKAFRSTHAITLISQYPFRHVQIILRLYNSPSEVLMGFDVDSCAVGYNGTDVVCCPRTVLAFATASNTVDLTRRSPSYEMRLSKYAQRGFEVLVPQLIRSRIDPFLYEKRFDQTAGLSRLLLLERLRTPLERLQYRLEGQLKNNHHHNSWQIQHKIQMATRDVHSLHRAEGTDGIVLPAPTGAEMSDYSTVFLPWGPAWTVARIERQTQKKDRILNSIEFLSNGRVVNCTRKYKIHVCAVGTMEEVIRDPFPDDPPIPAGVPPEALEGTVHGPISWLVDNPGRQQIGSFHPITDTDWLGGAYFSQDMEKLIVAALTDQVETMKELLTQDPTLIQNRDFLGRSVLHVAILARSKTACVLLLQDEYVTADLLNARMPNGRTALHLAAMKGQVETVQLILEATDRVLEAAAKKDEDCDEDSRNDDNDNGNEVTIDIDTGDWNVKMSALQYAVFLGHVPVAKVLLEKGADARKIAVHKDNGFSISTLSLLAMYASECGLVGYDAVVPTMMDMLLQAGASPTQVDTAGSTCWHRLACSRTQSAAKALEQLLQADQKHTGGQTRALNLPDKNGQTPLYVATMCGNTAGVTALLKAGAVAVYSKDDFIALLNRNNRSVYDNQIDAYRFPIMSVLRSGKTHCLKEFLDFDASIANMCFEMYEHSHDYSLGWQNREPKVIKKRMMDVLEEVLEGLKDGIEPSGASNIIQRQRQRHQRDGLEHIEASLKGVDKVIREAEAKRDEHPKSSYEWMVWNMASIKYNRCDRANILVQKTQYEYSASFNSTNKSDRIKHVEEAIELVKQAGGIKEPPLLVEEENQPAPMHHPLPHNRDLVQVFALTAAIHGLSFQEAENLPNTHGNYRYNYRYGRRQQMSLSEKMLKAFNTLMNQIICNGFQGVTDAAFQSAIFVRDAFFMTPFFMAVLKGNMQAAITLFSTSQKQYAEYLRAEKLKAERRNQGNDEAADANAPVRDQLRRLNNLDIASGETPQDTGPTPDQIRLELEAAEAAAIESSAAAANEEAAAEIINGVFPTSLLLYRAVVADLPALNDLKKKLIESHPESFSKPWEGCPARLRAIELAVIKKDLEGVKALLQLARDASRPDLPKETDEQEATEPEVAHRDSDEDDYSDDEADDEAGGQEPKTEAANDLTRSEMRYLLTGEASRNPDLGSVTLPQLAIVIGDVEILRCIAEFGRENLLPRGAIAYWKSQVEEADAVDEATKTLRNQQNQAISGDDIDYYHDRSWQFDVWTGDRTRSIQSVTMSTLLQFSLSVESSAISTAIMEGALDETLVGWLKDGPKEVSRNLMSGGKSKGMCLAEKWLCSHVKEQNVSVDVLASKLVRPTALDNLGRNALFYAPEHMIRQVASAGFQLSSNEDEKGNFLNAVCSKGSVTPLMAAASSLELDRVKALLEIGCSRTILGSKNWNVIHLTLPESVAKMDRWPDAIKVIGQLLTESTGDEVNKLLVAPASEHTPLMLALERGLDAAAIEELLALSGETQTQVLGRFDKDLNSCLHTAVTKALGPRVNDQTGDALGTVKLLLNQADTGASARENANGVTPAELALETTTMIWNRVNLNGIMTINQNRATKLAKDKGEDPAVSRQAVATLQDESHPRAAVSFDMVQEAKDNAVEKAKTIVVQEQRRTRVKRRFGGNETDVKPTGKPAIFPRNENCKTQAGMVIDNGVINWRGWPF